MIFLNYLLSIHILQAGISSAYQEKPCLDPYDPDCPETAPNYESKQVCCIVYTVTDGRANFRFCKQLLFMAVDKAPKLRDYLASE